MNAGFPIRYVDPVFRPPSEAESLILPVTDGCSWNECTFCEMYVAPQKAFRARTEDEVLASIRHTGEAYGDQIRRVFLADGDADTARSEMGIGRHRVVGMQDTHEVGPGQQPPLDGA